MRTVTSDYLVFVSYLWLDYQLILYIHPILSLGPSCFGGVQSTSSSHNRLFLDQVDLSLIFLTLDCSLVSKSTNSVTNAAARLLLVLCFISIGTSLLDGNSSSVLSTLSPYKKHSVIRLIDQLRTYVVEVDKAKEKPVN